MLDNNLKFKPDYDINLPEILLDILKAREISLEDFASESGLYIEWIKSIIKGEQKVDMATAIKFEKVLGVSAKTWLNMLNKNRDK